MKILVLNGSPKGERSTTLQTVRYLQVLHPEHQFLELPVGQRIKRYEKDFSTPREALSQAEVILFCYPYTRSWCLINCIVFWNSFGQMEWTFRERLPLKLPRPSTFTM